jgi:hypothetical protein
MQNFLSIIFLGLIAISCTDNRSDGIPDATRSRQAAALDHRDSLILNFVIDEFPMRSSDTALIVMELLHDDQAYKETVIYPEGYKFRLYDFSFGTLYDPFVITITDSKDSLISLFSFTDEVSYSSENRYYKRLVDDKLTIEPNSYRRDFKLKPNLEENLNDLKLGYQDDHKKVKTLLDVILLDLLKMERPNFWQKRSSLNYLDKFKTDNQEIIKAIGDFKNLDKTLRDCSDCLLYQTEGLFGYWLIEFDVHRETTKEALMGTVKLKVKFISEVLYMAPVGVDG